VRFRRRAPERSPLAAGTRAVASGRQPPPWSRGRLSTDVISGEVDDLLRPPDVLRVVAELASECIVGPPSRAATAHVAHDEQANNSKVDIRPSIRQVGALAPVLGRDKAASCQRGGSPGPGVHRRGTSAHPRRRNAVAQKGPPQANCLLVGQVVNGDAQASHLGPSDSGTREIRLVHSPSLSPRRDRYPARVASQACAGGGAIAPGHRLLAFRRPAGV
jgi:hypothetical protein